MIYIAILELIIIALLVWVIRDLVLKMAEDKRRAETNLLSVLGKTETVALTMNDERPTYGITYMDEAKVVELDRQVRREA